MPFNFAQVVIAAFGAMALSVLAYFVARVIGASMEYSGGLFQNLDFIHIVRFTALPILILGFLTFLVGRAKPGYCRIAQVIGVAAVLASAVVQWFFAEDWGTALTVAIMHLVVAASWYISVNYSNRKFNEIAALENT
ncbi:DUF6069 family protein [Glutamicibacter sp. AGC13]